MIQTLKQFTSGARLFDAVSALLAKLHIEFDRETAEPISVADLYDGPMPQYLTDALQSIENTYFIGYVNDQSLSGNKSNLSLEEHQRLGAKYNYMTVFACDTKPSAHLSRTMEAALTRGFNRMAEGAPLILVIRQNNLLSLAACERTDRKNGGEKLGKVTMLRNINCEHVHAGHRQLLELVADNVKGSTTFDELYIKWLTTFNIDVLGDAFFDGYKTIYEDIIEYVTGKRMVKEGGKWVEKDNHEPCTKIMAEFAGFADPEKTVRDYVKKLMGRLVFIQFLQRKGWMGVPAGDSWKGGDPEFLQNLFANSDKQETFVDDVLEPLFNDLNTKRHGDLLTLDRTVKVPYLNGGLFELDESDDSTFALPGRFFKKLFDFFASYNFTIDENAPDNVEIGVDPEMLGRIFENLLEDNKEKGAFYTPKEIVQYMCRESLIAYLTTCVMKKQGDSRNPEEQIRDAVRRLLAEPEVIVPKMSEENLADFGNYIREVKICDPAIGSGAFPMGLLSELVRCRAIIGAWAKDAYDNLLSGDYAALKTEIICNNIYGVDIEKGAIDIARLRFWLSIIVDLKVPHALPNFDYKFMQGNSLITTFNGEYVNLDTKNQTHIKVNEMKKEKQNLYNLKQNYYVSQGEQKHEIAVEIKKSILRLVSMQIGYELRSWYEKNIAQTTCDFDGQKRGFEDIKRQLPQDKQDLVNHANALYKQLNDTNVDVAKRALIDISFFDWRIMFTEVFDGDNGGFDIVIGNPPYISAPSQIANQVLSKQRENIIKSNIYKTLYQKWDLYIPFIEHGIQLACNNGIITMIVPYPLTNQTYGKKLREMIVQDCDMFELCDLNGTKIFENATVSNCIPFVRKIKPEALNTAISHIAANKVISRSFCKNEDDLVPDKKTAVWNVGEEKRDTNRHADMHVLGDFCYISVGMVVNADEKTAKGEFKKEDLISLTKDEIHCRKYIEAKDIEKYNVKRVRYLEYNTERCPDQLRRPTFRELYEYDRLIMNCLGTINCTIDGEDNYLHNHSIYCAVPWHYLSSVQNKSITSSIKKFSTMNRPEMEILSSTVDLRYLLGIMNSTYADVLLTNLRAGDYHIYPEHIRNIPIPTVTKDLQQPIIELVDQILSLKKQNSQADTSALEHEIDLLVYDLYGLTPEEIAIVEGTNNA